MVLKIKYNWSPWGTKFAARNNTLCVPRNNYGHSSVSSAANNDESVDEFEKDNATNRGNVVKGGNYHSDEAAQYECSSEMIIKGSVKAKKISHPCKTKCSKSPKSTLKISTDFCCSEREGKVADEQIQCERIFFFFIFIILM